MLGFKKLFICMILGLGIACGITGQPSTYVDEQGVMRWTENDEEVTAFGVNYGTPFAHPFRAHNYMGIPHEMAIDADVYHFARMGLDGYRIHVWDTEISDSAGNLLFNKHLQLFDYLLFRLKERQIKMFITPMNFYTNGYPERGTPTPGFQNYFEGKRGCLTDTASFPVQENYLSQFVSHVNPYTGIAYKDEPYIVAVEINNEPFNHGDRPDLTTEYIDRMAAAIRSTGFEKPIFYNVSHNVNQTDNFCAAQIQGGTFQWYPTGLVSGHDIKGNMLPNVDEYLIPFDNHPRFKNMARAVYEFSPADVGASGHIYPVMARSFREKGFQIAAQFAYDPAAMGHANTDYQTHYLSLPFSPKKAMGMMIASEVFHRIPLRKSFGRYPDNLEFDVFRISYEEDLAEMVTEEKFLHSNSTTTSPPDPVRLEQVAGTGRSPVVEYEGTGAYFLDKLEPGVWRLEVMPDAIWVKDPFARPSLDRKASVVIWKTWPMTIKLPDLGDDFAINGLNEGNNIQMTASGMTFPVSPGTYLLTRRGTTSNLGGDDHWHNITLKEFYAPETNCHEIHVLHQSPGEINVGSRYFVKATVVSPGIPEAVNLDLRGGFYGRGQVIPMKRTSGYEYEAEIPSTLVEEERQLRYYITVTEKGISRTYPSGIKKLPSDWDFYDDTPYQLNVVDPVSPICLFDADRDKDQIGGRGAGAMTAFSPSPISGKTLMHFNARNLTRGEHHVSMRFYFADKVGPRLGDTGSMNELTIYGHSLNDKPCNIEMTLVMRDGSAYGGIVTLGVDEGLYRIPVRGLKKVRSPLLPGPFPGFQAYWFQPASVSKLDLAEVETLLISIGPGIPEKEYDQMHGVAVGRVTLR